MTEKLVSKVLVLDDQPEHLNAFKVFCEAHNLVPLKVRKNRLMSVLRSNIDLGAIFIAEDYVAAGEGYLDIAIRIHAIRPELPIILRRKQAGALEDLGPTAARVFCAVYSANDTSALEKVIEDYIFSLYYPCELVRGISQITESVLGMQFRNQSLEWETPCIVRDRVIFGEVFSLIPLESAWCRGYMMIQTEEQAILDIISRDAADDADAGFRKVNSLLGEITNLIWGAFKNRYIGDSAAANQHVQVPLVVNHKHKYISFGTENPQLCFLYTVTDEETGRSVRFFQRFVFNLNWSPEDFKEIIHDTSELVEAGELELF
jgi:CheY-specific phosphatase CheX